jgi:hypothetical protein
LPVQTPPEVNRRIGLQPPGGFAARPVSSLVREKVSNYQRVAKFT